MKSYQIVLDRAAGVRSYAMKTINYSNVLILENVIFTLDTNKMY